MKPGTGGGGRVASDRPIEWIGGRAPSPMWITGEGEPYRPDALVWVEGGSGLILGLTVAPPTAPASALAASLEELLAGPAGAAGPPVAVRVADEAQAAELKSRLGDRVEVRVAPTPEIDDVLRHMRQTMGHAPEVDSYLEAGRIEASTVGRMFTAAARLWRAAPWDYVWDQDLLLVEAPALGAPRRCVSIVGRLGESFGLLLFDSVESYRAFDRFGAALDRGEHREGDPLPMPSPLLSLAFDKRTVLSKRMRSEIKAQRWEVAGPGACPRILWIEADGGLRPLTAGAYRLASAVATAVAAFFERHGDALDEGEFGGASEATEVEADGARCTVRVTAPHPEAPWELDDDDDNPYDDDEDDEATDEELVAAAHEEAVELVGRFVEDARSRGRDESWCQAAGFVCESFYEFLIDHVGSLIDDDIEPEDLEEYCLDFFPRQVTADDEVIEALPQVLTENFAWLAEAGRLERDQAERLRQRLESLRTRFQRAARDPRRFGPAKTVMTQMLAEGVDPTDEAAVAEYMKRFTDESVGAPPSPPPLSQDGDHDAPTRAPRPRWEPEPGEPCPAPTDPCPCGSGRRYKKCCLRR